MKVTIYHNPRCSKSRQTLELLVRKGIEPEIIEYLKTPPDRKTLQEIIKLLDMKPADLLRKKEQAYKDAGLDNDDVSDDRVLTAMLEYPVLIERPIVIAGNRAAIGRPPESVLDIL